MKRNNLVVTIVSILALVLLSSCSSLFSGSEVPEITSVPEYHEVPVPDRDVPSSPLGNMYQDRSEAMKAVLDENRNWDILPAETDGNEVAEDDVSSEEMPSPVFSDEYPDVNFDLNRYALVIGNGKYSDTPLSNPVNDALLMKKALEGAGFDVFYYENLDNLRMQVAVSSFLNEVNSHEKSTALLYYAGHGIEIDGKNYLLPIDNNRINSPEDVQLFSLDLDRFLSMLKSPEQIIILDACRDNPYRTGSNRAVGIKGGLGAVRNRKSNVTMSYLFAAQSGAVAEDGDGQNSVFTAILAEEMQKADVPIYEVFNTVASRVKGISDGKQVPLASSTGSDFVFQNEAVSLKVYEQWQKVLAEAEVEIGKAGKNVDLSSNSALIEAEARKAMADAELKASLERAERVRKEAKIREEEAKKASDRSKDLQSRIEEMKMAAENASLKARSMQYDHNDPFSVIEEIERNSSIEKELRKSEDVLIGKKKGQLYEVYKDACTKIDGEPYKVAELDSNGKPTSLAIKARQMKKDQARNECDAALEEYKASIVGVNKEECVKMHELIRAMAQNLEGETFAADSAIGTLSVYLSPFDGLEGGWKMHMTTDHRMNHGGCLFDYEFFLPYRELTDHEMVTEIKTLEDMREYDTYIEQVDMFDTLFRSEVPIINARVEYRVEVEGGLAYVFVPEKLEIRRTDNQKVIIAMDEKEVQDIFGIPYILKNNDWRTKEERNSDKIDMSAWAASNDDDVFNEVPSFISGTVMNGCLINETYLDHYNCVYLPKPKKTVLDGKGFHGWFFEGDSVLYSPGSLIEARDKGKPQYEYCPADIDFTDLVISNAIGDMKLHRGMKTQVKMRFKNTGIMDITGIKLEVTTPIDEVRIVDGTANWERMPYTRDISFDVILDGRLKSGSQVPINWLMTSDNGAWRGSFEIEVN